MKQTTGEKEKKATQLLLDDPKTYLPFIRGNVSAFVKRNKQFKYLKDELESEGMVKLCQMLPELAKVKPDYKGYASVSLTRHFLRLVQRLNMPYVPDRTYSRIYAFLPTTLPQEDIDRIRCAEVRLSKDPDAPGKTILQIAEEFNVKPEAVHAIKNAPRTIEAVDEPNEVIDEHSLNSEVDLWEELCECCLDETDRLILEMRSEGYSDGSIAASAELNLTAIYLRRRALYGRYLKRTGRAGEV